MADDYRIFVTTLGYHYKIVPLIGKGWQYTFCVARPLDGGKILIHDKSLCSGLCTLYKIQIVLKSWIGLKCDFE